LPPGSRPQPREPLDATPDNPYHPFEDRLAFKFADFHFREQQSSEGHINCALELWAAQAAKSHANNLPWKSAGDMYVNINAIHQGSNPWRTTLFCYQGKLLGNTLKWTTQSYKLVTCNICSVLHTQIGCTEFKGHWDYVPFMEFDGGGDHVWTNIMSSEWVAKQAVCVPLPSLFLQAHLLCM
jgi:hypothetical protein